MGIPGPMSRRGHGVGFQGAMSGGEGGWTSQVPCLGGRLGPPLLTSDGVQVLEGVRILLRTSGGFRPLANGMCFDGCR